MNARAVLLGAVCLVAIGCTAAPGATSSVTPIWSEPAATVEPTPASTPSPTLTPAPSPSPTLPVDPVLVETTTSDNTVIYEIAVAPASEPLDLLSATARAKKIGALVGFGKPDFLYQDPNDTTWKATWTQAFDRIPVEGGVLLQMGADGAVEQFYEEIGPRAPKPAKLITRAQADKAAGGKSNEALIEWSKAGTDTYHLVWRLHFGTSDSAAGKYSCFAEVDAGTAEVLQSGCVS